MYSEWYGVCDFVVLSVVELCTDYGGVNVFCLIFCVAYGVGVCVNVCGVVTSYKAGYKMDHRAVLAFTDQCTSGGTGPYRSALVRN